MEFKDEPNPEESLQVNASRPTEGFVLETEEFKQSNIKRLDRGYGVSARYLAIGENGSKVCLTVFPYEEIMRRHGQDLPEYQTSIAKRAFLSEPEVLRKLQKAEEKIGTHYFPRMMTGVNARDTNNPWYVIEFVEGTGIADVTLEQAKKLRGEFERAIKIAQSVSVHFSDLRIEDLRVLPDGSVMIIDFNSSSYPHIDEEQAIRNDFDRLDEIYKGLESREEKQRR